MKEMNSKDSLNSQDFASNLVRSHANITSLLGLCHERLNNFGKILKLKQSFLMLIQITILVQSIALVTLSITVLRIEKKISTIQTELNTLAEK